MTCEGRISNGEKNTAGSPAAVSGIMTSVIATPQYQGENGANMPAIQLPASLIPTTVRAISNVIVNEYSIIEAPEVSRHRSSKSADRLNTPARPAQSTLARLPTIGNLVIS